MLRVADELLFVAGRTLAGLRLLRGERQRKFEGNHDHPRHIDVLCVGRRWVCEAARAPRRREKAF